MTLPPTQYYRKKYMLPSAEKKNMLDLLNSTVDFGCTQMFCCGYGCCALPTGSSMTVRAGVLDVWAKNVHSWKLRRWCAPPAFWHPHPAQEKHTEVCMPVLLSGDTKSSDTNSGEEEMVGPSRESPLAPVICSTKDFPQEQWWQSELSLSASDKRWCSTEISVFCNEWQFILSESWDSYTGRARLVPKSRREFIFQAIFHLLQSYDKNLE